MDRNTVYAVPPGILLAFLDPICSQVNCDLRLQIDNDRLRTEYLGFVPVSGGSVELRLVCCSYAPKLKAWERRRNSNGDVEALCRSS